MAGLRVQLFGRLHVWRDGVLLADLDVKARELFSYLLIYRDRPHAREALAELLWADAVPDRLRKYLRQTLWQLQGAVGGSNPADQPVLRVETEWVQLSPEAGIGLDIAELDAAVARTRDVRGRDLDAEQAGALRQASALYRGDLLEGWYQDWCIFERERLQAAYLAILDKLMEYAEAVGTFDEGVEYGNSILRLDRARERTHRRLMRLHALGGDRTGALRQFERCAAALREELGVAPSPRTLVLLAEIRADRLLGPAGAPGLSTATPGLPAVGTPVVTPAMTPAVTLPEVLTHLQQLEGTLAGLQQSLHQDVVVLTQALRQPE